MNQLITFCMRDDAELQNLTKDQLIVVVEEFRRLSKTHNSIVNDRLLAENIRLKDERDSAVDRADYWLEQFNAKHSDVELELAEEVCKLKQDAADKAYRIGMLELRVDQLEHPENYIVEEDIF